MMIEAKTTNSLLDRFPHLRREIHLLLRRNSGFKQLNEDYALLIRSLSNSQFEAEGDREEMVNLKKALELEALELLTQTGLE
jgi:hypothetical protein